MKLLPQRNRWATKWLGGWSSLEYKKSVWMVEVKRAKGEGRGTEMLICRFSSQPVSTQAGLAVTMTATSTEWRFWSNKADLWNGNNIAGWQGYLPKKLKKKQKKQFAIICPMIGLHPPSPYKRNVLVQLWPHLFQNLDSSYAIVSSYRIKRLEL